MGNKNQKQQVLIPFLTFPTPICEPKNIFGLLWNIISKRAKIPINPEDTQAYTDSTCASFKEDTLLETNNVDLNEKDFEQFWTSKFR